MSETELVVWRTLDTDAEIDISHRQLPHWDQTGALTFVTFRLADSLPRSVLELWEREQLDWLERNGLNGISIEDALNTGRLQPAVRRQFMKFRKGRWHGHLDDCHGSCVLRESEHAEQVGESLLKFDSERYDMERFVVMPNHVHLLVQMRTGFGLRKQCESWLRFTGRKINAAIGRSGEFWQSEPFDHVIRSEEQFEYLRRYIEENPVKARLGPGEYLFWKRA